LIKRSKDAEEAKGRLMAGEFAKDRAVTLSEVQSKAILEMRLQRLTGLERDKIKVEYADLKRQIDYYNELLASEVLQRAMVKTELTEVKERFNDPRRTEITFAEGEIKIEDMIANDEVVVTISHLGYIKRTKSDEYRIQNRGGRGAQGSKTRNEDFIEHIFVANVHNYLLLFTEKGRCFWLRVYEIPEATKNSSGRVIQNIVGLPQDDKVKAYIIIEDLEDETFLNNHYIMFCTRNGLVKKTEVSEFSRPRATGINAISIREDDQLIEAKLTDGTSNIVIASNFGRAVHFKEEDVRPMGRTAAGVRGISIEEENNFAIGMVVFTKEDVKTKNILVITEKGNGKQTPLVAKDDNNEPIIEPETGDYDYVYRLASRGGKGVKTLQITKKTGNLIAIKAVSKSEDLMIINKSGVVIRVRISDISELGRATQGVRLIRIDEDDAIADVTLVPENDADVVEVVEQVIE
jgi:DNA gyrase subunit A